MKNLIAILTLALFCGVSTQAFSQTAEKTFVKSFNLKGMQVVVLNLDGNVEVQQWKNDIMRVQMTIALPKSNATTLKSLAKAGRYNLKSKVGDDAYTVYAPGMQREVRIKGENLSEKVSYIVYAPENVVVRMADEASTDKSTATKLPSTL